MKYIPTDEIKRKKKLPTTKGRRFNKAVNFQTT